MEQLVARARSSMNVLLLAVVLIGWSAFQEGPDAVETATEIVRLAMSADAEGRPAAVSGLIDEIELAKSRGAELREAVASLRVAAILSLQDVGLGVAEISGQPSEERAALLRQLGRDVASMDSQEEREARASAVQDLLRNDGAAQFRRRLDHLDSLFAKAGVREVATVAELQDALALTINVPFVEQVVPTRLAVPLASIALLGPLLYLLSVCRTIRSECEHLSEREGSDWIFFHIGVLGPTLGILWVASPALALCAAWIGSGFTQSYLLALAVPSAILAVLVVSQALRARGIRSARLAPG